MITLTAFSQGSLLSRTVADPSTRNGVCVALCDHWLSRIKQHPTEPAPRRCLELAQALSKIILYQQSYAIQRRQHGRIEARHQIGQQLGLEYADQTTIMRVAVGMKGIRQKLAGDISHAGSAATWTLRFADNTGHAIAGFCGISGQEPIIRLQLHVFDPNIGEYIGQLAELDGILNDLLTKFPKYQTVTEVCRTAEG